MQTSLDLEIHSRENNSESEQILNEKNKHFSNKCKELLTRLCNGERLQFADCVKTIGDLRRRSADLIEFNNIPVQRTFISNTRIKEYWLKQEDIFLIKNKYSL